MARRSLTACLAPNPYSDHHKTWLGRVGEGLARHGVAVKWITPKGPCDGDFVACWGWRQAGTWIDRAPAVLVLECGYLGERTTEWISLGWNGLNGRADFCNADVPSDRATRWARLLKPCRDFGPGPIVVMGQVAGDQAWGNENAQGWYRRTYAALTQETDRTVLFRPHPLGRPLEGYAQATGSLDEALSMAAGVVTFNSNSGVDAVLAGVPTIAMDAGSMVHGLVPDRPPFVRIDEAQRQRWLERISYCQWNVNEISDGMAWDHIKRGL